MSYQEAIDAFKQKCATLAAAQKEVGDSLIPTLKAIVSGDSPIRVIAVYGYTPSWNDGDPCRHCQIESINHLDDDEGSFSWVPRTAPLIPEHQATQEEKEITNFVSSLSRDLERKFGTNWCLAIYRDDAGVVHYFKDNYDCGY